ncbi:uncharacterized protein BXZ73DRAFT_14684, partial [Epithele typhae]|uniref:uncharacterized protein n=1 Tax=Epithele typhae TaxID=378194 RepID=UPI0020076BC1
TLVSLRKADSKGYSSTIANGVLSLTHRATSDVIAHIPEHHGLYQVASTDYHACAALAASGDAPSRQLLDDIELHRVMGHISVKAARDMVDKGRVEGITITDWCAQPQCSVCISAKITRAPVPKAADGRGAAELGLRVKAYGDRIDADTWDPGHTSIGGSKYATLFVD